MKFQELHDEVTRTTKDLDDLNQFKAAFIHHSCCVASVFDLCGNRVNHVYLHGNLFGTQWYYISSDLDNVLKELNSGKNLDEHNFNEFMAECGQTLNRVYSRVQGIKSEQSSRVRRFSAAS